jgi:MSHA biogenesis protein MshM
MTMYLEHFGLREAPFKITPHTEFFFAGANRGETLEALIYAITSGEGIVKVTGEVGAGKTMLCRVLMERLPKSVETIYFAVPSLSPDELLATVANDLGVSTDGGNITKLIRALQSRLIEIHGSGKRVVALIDEAHAMPVETLDQIRLLSNLETSHEKLIQIVLFGQPELDQHLSMPNIRQLKERITHGFNLLPLPARDIKDYLNFRLRAAGYHGPDLFGPDALRLITEASEGLTRRINIYADKTMLAAYAAGTHTITPDHVRAAISDTQIVLPGAKSSRRNVVLAIAAALASGIVIGFVVSRYAMPTTSVPTPLAAQVPISISHPAPAASREITKSAETVVSPEGQSVNTALASDQVTPAKRGDSTSAPKVDGVTAAQAQVPPPKIAVAAPIAEVPNKSPGGERLDKRIADGAALIAAQPNDRYAIQLMSAEQRSVSAIESYLQSASRELNTDLILVYPAGGAENPRVSVLYGNFNDRAEADTALANLPPRMARFRPYVRSFGAVRNDVRPTAH